MAHLTRIKPADWAANEKLTSAQMNALDTNLAKCINGDEGGTWNPSAQIVIGGSGMRLTGRSIERVGVGTDANTTFPANTYDTIIVKAISADRICKFDTTDVVDGTQIVVAIDTAVTGHKVTLKQLDDTFIAVLSGPVTGLLPQYAIRWCRLVYSTSVGYWLLYEYGVGLQAGDSQWVAPGNTLTVQGSTVLSGALTASGVATFSNTVTITGATTIDDACVTYTNSAHTRYRPRVGPDDNWTSFGINDGDFFIVPSQSAAHTWTLNNTGAGTAGDYLEITYDASGWTPDPGNHLLTVKDPGGATLGLVGTIDPVTPAKTYYYYTLRCLRYAGSWRALGPNQLAVTNP